MQAAVAVPKVIRYFRGVLRLTSAATLLYVGVAGMAQAGLAQSSAVPASAGRASAVEKHPKFEVISIRRHTAESGPAQTGPTPTGFRSIGLPMFAIFQLAYALPNQRGLLRGDQIEGDPGWLTGELYDVVAKVDQADLADWQKPAMRQTLLRAMLQAMLAERCKVVVHYGSKEAPVYDLVIAKGGPKFKRAETVDTAELRQKHPTGGMMLTQFYAISVTTFANTILSSLADRPVVDKTGLTGYYDLALPSSALRPPPPPPPAPVTSQPLDGGVGVAAGAGEGSGGGVGDRSRGTAVRELTWQTASLENIAVGQVRLGMAGREP